MKNKVLLFIIGVGYVAISAGAIIAYAIHPKWITDRQVAAGEWKIEMQTPPCDSVHNLQVIWPQESGAPLTVECDQMPVGER